MDGAVACDTLALLTKLEKKVGCTDSSERQADEH